MGRGGGGKIDSVTIGGGGNREWTGRGGGKERMCGQRRREKRGKRWAEKEGEKDSGSKGRN